MPDNPVRHGGDALRTMAPHVAYRIRMLLSLDAYPKEMAPWVIKNAMTESSIMHLRAMHEFFTRTKSRHDDDVFATDYVPESSLEEFLPERWAGLLDKYLPHNTIEAFRTPNPDWPLDVLIKKTTERYERFLGALSVAMRAAFGPTRAL